MKAVEEMVRNIERNAEIVDRRLPIEREDYSAKSAADGFILNVNL